MTTKRCPYHVKQGLVDSQGQFVLSDICGVKSACGAPCPHAPFEENSHQSCSRFLSLAIGANRQVLIPKNDIEYIVEASDLGRFSETDLI